MAENCKPSYDDLLAALVQINNLIYAAGAPLGSSNYFAIRRICCDAVNGAQQKTTKENCNV